MPLLIDGYNLLHATDIFGEGSGPGYFQRSREALLAFLGSSLTEAERLQTTIVFDATDALPGLPNNYPVAGMTVTFARNYPDADTLLEEIIEQHLAPRGLLVVSSDHRVQRAARQRGSKYVDSDQWYRELWQRRVGLRRQQQKSVPEKPVGQLSAAEIAYWVEQFDDRSDDASDAGVEPSPDDSDSGGLDNPFPPGYGEDLLHDDEI
ncbi:MAG: NYN domain-containing protein [Planctomycetota bacterium]